ncbi:MAG: 2-oxo acid dehydrogenase subunit E2 [Deltaproteobacteria bacterium]|jgi:pyruvate dehydrogenase E2 component (dihydrolipoamide acetyltransferase)|nr:2-oxo acid dehydrogenase subunit E2 [Deltaproteobacteria bacterium]
MAVNVLMPKLGLTMETGVIARWNFKDGDTVKAGDAIYQVETDKLTNDVLAEADGILRIRFAAGAVVPATEVVGVIVGPSEAAPWAGAPAGAATPAAHSEASAPATPAPFSPTTVGTGRPRATPKARKLAMERGIDLTILRGSGPGGMIAVKDLEGARPPRVSPLAAKLAVDLGADLSAIRKEGRIMKADVLAVAARPVVPPVSDAGADGRCEPMSAMRRAIARNMSASWNIAPMVSYNLRADVTALAELKKNLNIERKVSYTDLLIKLVARALQAHPLLNASVEGEEIILHEAVHMGLAVALEDGLIVPVIRNAESKSLGEIADEAALLAEKARQGRLTPDEYTGGTFTLTNLGMFGMESFTPIINQPESAILGVNAIVRTAVEVDGRIVMRPLMNLSLTADHRAANGAEAAMFLALVRDLVENPWKLLL